MGSSYSWEKLSIEWKLFHREYGKDMKTDINDKSLRYVF